MNVILAPPPDLIVSQVVANDEYVTGDTMVVQYTISNVGAGNPFESYWRDRLVSFYTSFNFCCEDVLYGRSISILDMHKYSLISRLSLTCIMFV